MHYNVTTDMPSLHTFKIKNTTTAIFNITGMLTANDLYRVCYVVTINKEAITRDHQEPPSVERGAVNGEVHFNKDEASFVAHRSVSLFNCEPSLLVRASSTFSLTPDVVYVLLDKGYFIVGYARTHVSTQARAMSDGGSLVSHCRFQALLGLHFSSDGFSCAKVNEI